MTWTGPSDSGAHRLDRGGLPATVGAAVRPADRGDPPGFAWGGPGESQRYYPSPGGGQRAAADHAVDHGAAGDVDHAQDEHLRGHRAGAVRVGEPRQQRQEQQEALRLSPLTPNPFQRLSRPRRGAGAGSGGGRPGHV